MSLRHLIYLLVFILAVAIQWPLWFGKGGVLRMQALEAELASVRAANDRLRAENDAAAAEQIFSPKRSDLYVPGSIEDGQEAQQKSRTP